MSPGAPPVQPLWGATENRLESRHRKMETLGCSSPHPILHPSGVVSVLSGRGALSKLPGCGETESQERWHVQEHKRGRSGGASNGVGSPSTSTPASQLRSSSRAVRPGATSHLLGSTEDFRDVLSSLPLFPWSHPHHRPSPLTSIPPQRSAPSWACLPHRPVPWGAARVCSLRPCPHRCGSPLRAWSCPALCSPRALLDTAALGKASATSVPFPLSFSARLRKAGLSLDPVLLL